MTTIAVMQPYFFPYTGYYRLFTAADVFVIFDCVQFPRRGYVHRNRLFDHAGRLSWLTLPLAHSPVDTTISGLRFAPGADAEWRRRLLQMSASRAFDAPGGAALGALVTELGDDPAAYLERTLRGVIAALRIETRIIRSSGLGLPADLRGASRILEICRRLRASHYVNAPGGRHLYDADAFARHGVALRFLPPWNGPSESILQRMVSEPLPQLAEEIRNTGLGSD